MVTITKSKPTTLKELRDSGWVSKTVKRELYDNFMCMLRSGEDLFPGIIGYESTVIPEINIAVIAGHDMLFLGEKGQAKSRLMRLLVRFLDPEIPYLDIPGCPVHEDPFHPITQQGKRFVEDTPEGKVPIAWWPREQRYAERLAPGTKFADVIGEIDPAKLASGTSMSAEEALHFGLIPRMHRAVFAMNELPELDELVQVGLFNILEERDVQIRGYPVRFDIDVLILFSANPATYNRSGKVIPQLKDRIGSIVHTHYPQARDVGIQIMEQEAHTDLGGEFPVQVPYFMREIVEQMSIAARKSKYIDQQSGVSARFSIANYRTMIATCPATGGAAGGETLGAADFGPGALLRIESGQAGTGHDGQPPDDGEAGSGCDPGGGDQDGLRRVRRQARPGGDRRGLRQGGEARGRGHAAELALRVAAQEGPARMGEGLRGQCRGERGCEGLLRRIRPGWSVRQRPDQPIAASWQDHI